MAAYKGREAAKAACRPPASAKPAGRVGAADPPGCHMRLAPVASAAQELDVANGVWSALNPGDHMVGVELNLPVNRRSVIARERRPCEVLQPAAPA